MDEVSIDRTDEPPAASAQRRGLMLRWGLPASVIAHLLVVAFLLVTLPVPQSTAPEEPVVNVDIVDPPEEQTAAEEEAAPELVVEEPEQASSEEDQADTEEQAAEQPEAQPPEAEEPAAEEQPPEEPAVEEPEPEPEQVEPVEPEQQVEEEQVPEQPAPEEQASQPAAGEQQGQSEFEALDPVFEFGEEDAGPREAPDGNSVQDGGLVEDVPAEITSPFDELTADVPTPSARPEDGPRISVVPDAELPQAKQLFSTQADTSPAATRAMANIPRGDRGADLCATELREQLRNATPAYWPDLLPAYPLDEGTAIEVRDGAFRAQGQWYDLAFRCEVDPDVRRVVSFALDVGDPIPRNEWRARGFPAF